jgi:hypothetical protein
MLIPSTAPSWRKLELMAEPMAYRPGGSDWTAAPDWTGRVSPMPRPISRVQGSQWVTQCGELPTESAKAAEPSAQEAAPASRSGRPR